MGWDGKYQPRGGGGTGWEGRGNNIRATEYQIDKSTMQLLTDRRKTALIN